MDIDKIQDKSKKVFGKQKEILFAYLFGSLAKRDVSPRSDIDLAVYLKEELSYDERFEKRLELIGELQELRPAPFVDLIVLNDAPIILSFNVIREGELLLCRDELKRIHFEAKTMSMFYDQQYYFKRHAEMIIDRMAAGG